MKWFLAIFCLLSYSSGFGLEWDNFDKNWTLKFLQEKGANTAVFFDCGKKSCIKYTSNHEEPFKFIDNGYSIFYDGQLVNTESIPCLNSRFFYGQYDWAFGFLRKDISEESREIFFDNLEKHCKVGVVIFFEEDVNQQKNIDTYLIAELSKRFLRRDYNKISFHNHQTTNRMIFWKDQEIKPKIFLVTFPRSGTHWLMYVLDKILPASRTGYLLKQFHYAKDINASGADFEKDYLILLVRNYMECFYRHFEDSSIILDPNVFFRPCFYSLIEGIFPSDYAFASDYFENLKFYESWDPAKRILIYYEDLITDFESVMKNIIGFLGEDPESVKKFMPYFHMYRQESIQKYQQTERSYSKGEDIYFHSMKVSFSTLLLLENKIRQWYPDIWDRYLQRYILLNHPNCQLNTE